MTTNCEWCGRRSWRRFRTKLVLLLCLSCWERSEQLEES